MSFIQQAYKGKNDWWRWAAILLISFSPYLFNVFEYLFNYQKQLDFFYEISNYIGDKANQLIFKTFIFYVPFLIILLLGVRYLHKRKVMSTINTVKNVRFTRIIMSLLVFSLLLVLGILIEYVISPEQFVLQYKQETFFALFAIVFIMSPIKVFFQEAFFRGYLMQGLATVLKSKWLAVLCVAVIFGGIFSLNANADYLEYNLLLFYIVTDVFLGVIVLLDEGIELAIGIGWANNVVAYLLVTHDWMPFKTDALFLNITKEPNYLYLVYLPIFVIYPLSVLCYNYIYKWDNWREKLFGAVEQRKEK